MFSATKRLVTILSSSLKYKPRIHVDTRCRAIMHLPKTFVHKSFFSSGNPPPVKTLLSTLVPKSFCSSGHSPLVKTILSKHTDGQNKEVEEQAGEAEASWRSMKITLIVFGISVSCLCGYLILVLGQPRLREDGSVIKDDFSDMSLIRQYLSRTMQELDYYRRLFEEPSREKLLPDVVQYPYYQPPYTLVLELTDVLVHPEWTYTTGWRFKKRPGIQHFLDSLNGQYEIVIYTAEQGITVFPILDVLDPKNIISYKLVRDATHFVDGHHVKDLDKLNRDLSKVIVVDWNLDSVRFHPENVLNIYRWNGNDDDTALVDLAAFLITIAQSDVEDVRHVLRHYSNFDDPLGTFRNKQKELIEFREAERLKKSQKEQPSVKRWSIDFFRKPF